MLLLLPDGFIVELCVIIWRNTKPNPFPLLTQKYIFFFNGKKCHRSHWNCCTATGTGKELLFFCLFWKRILRAFFKFLIPRFFVYYKRRCKSRGDCPFGVERKEKGKKGRKHWDTWRAPKRNPDQKLVGKSRLHGFHTGFASFFFYLPSVVICFYIIKSENFSFFYF